MALLLVALCACGTSSKPAYQESKYYEQLKDAGLKEKTIEQYLSYDYFHIKNLKRYLKYDAKSVKAKIIAVNMNKDKEPYTDIKTLTSDKIDELVNKFNQLPDGYTPDDLVAVNSACTRGVDYSCQDIDTIELRKPAATAFEQWVKAAAKQNMQIKAIAGYRTYAYQQQLWNYYASVNGTAYADQYYARPGTSEHNTGLAVDITFNNYHFNEIANYDGYDWLLKHAADYGFILRYPEDKTDETRYGYESWHFRYVGKTLAKQLSKNNETLEYYYATK